MRSSVLCLAISLCLALPHCDAILDVVTQKCSKAASAASSSSSSASETLVRKAGCGCGCGGNPLSCTKKARGVLSAASATSSGILGSVGRAVSGFGVPGVGSILSETQIKQKYAQLKGEPLDTYFKRIVSRSYEWTSTPDAYVKTLSLVWKDFNTLPLWYDRKYFSLIKDFYSSYFAQVDQEPLDAYYSRLVTRQAWETDDCFARRISVIRDCFPNLDLWTNPAWFDKYTKNLYALEFKRFAQESEVDYIKRIFEKDALVDVTDDIWAKRVFLIQEATITSCPLWYNDQYLSYFQNFYSIWYKPKETESEVAWLTRTLSLLPGESPENAIKRIGFIKQVTGDYGFWKPDFFQKLEVTKCFDSNWFSLVKKQFFPCGCK